MCQHHPVHRSVEPVTGGRPDARSSPHPLLHHVLIALPPVPYEGVVAPPVVDVAEFRHGKDWQRGRARWPPRSPPSALPLSVRAPRPAPAPAREDARPGRSSRGPPDPSQDPGTFRKEEAGGRRRRKGVRSLSGYSGEGRPPRSSGALPAGGGSGCGAAREAGLSARTPATAHARARRSSTRGDAASSARRWRGGMRRGPGREVLRERAPVVPYLRGVRHWPQNDAMASDACEMRGAPGRYEMWKRCVRRVPWRQGRGRWREALPLTFLCGDDGLEDKQHSRAQPSLAAAADQLPRRTGTKPWQLWTGGVAVRTCLGRTHTSEKISTGVAGFFCDKRCRS